MTTAAFPSFTVQKTFLQQCVKEQAPSHLSSLRSKPNLWQVAAVSTYVAFIVLTLGGVAASVIFAPVFLPLVTITSIFLLQYVKKVHDFFDQKSEEAGARATQIEKISGELQRLALATPQHLREILQQRGIENVASPENLIPLIARHRFWEEHIQDLEKKRQAKLAEAEKLSTENYADNKKEIFKLRCAALEIEKNGLEAKIKNAFVNAVIRKPRFAGKFEDLGSFSQVSAQERAISNANKKEPTINQLFIFKNHHQLAPITIDEAKKLTVSALAMRLLPALHTENDSKISFFESFAL